MSDQYIPPRTTPPRPTTAVPGPEPYRTDVRVDVAPPAPSDSGGFSTGVLVTIVFVVVAIIAAAVFSNRDTASTGTGNSAPAVTIENNAGSAPVETAIDPIAPTPAPAPAPDAPATPVAPVSPVAPVNP